jgi:hypothetical protein
LRGAGAGLLGEELGFRLLRVATATATGAESSERRISASSLCRSPGFKKGPPVPAMDCERQVKWLEIGKGLERLQDKK